MTLYGFGRGTMDGMKPTTIALAFLLVSCEEDPVTPQIPEEPAQMRDSTCLRVNESHATDWQLCNVGLDTFFCTVEGCIRIGCGR